VAGPWDFIFERRYLLYRIPYQKAARKDISHEQNFEGRQTLCSRKQEGGDLALLLKASKVLNLANSC
jgi:hypothetical protein